MGVRSALEGLNLKTDGSLKGDNIRYLSDEQLIALLAVSRSGVASGTTGMGIHGLLSCAGWAPSMFAAGVSFVQTGVALTNRDRIDDEIARRSATSPSFVQLLKQTDRPFRDVAVGSSLKVATSAMTLGVVGGLEASDLVSKSLMSPHELATQPFESAADEFKQEHPQAVDADKDVKSILAPVGDLVSDKLGAETGHNITDKTTWDGLNAMDPTGTNNPALMAQSAAVGIAGEANPAPLIVEHVVNKNLQESTQQKATENKYANGTEKKEV